MAVGFKVSLRRLSDLYSRGVMNWLLVESTYNWYWLVDGLQEAGFVVKLANTGAIKKYDGLKHSGDEADARQLAHQLHTRHREHHGAPTVEEDQQQPDQATDCRRSRSNVTSGGRGAGDQEQPRGGHDPE